MNIRKPRVIKISDSEALETILTLHAHGMSSHDIAKETGKTKDYVNRLLWLKGIEPNPPKGFVPLKTYKLLQKHIRDGLERSVIREELKISTSAVQKYYSNPKALEARVDTLEAKMNLQTLIKIKLKEGQSHVSISQELQCSTGVVLRVARSIHNDIHENARKARSEVAHEAIKHGLANASKKYHISLNTVRDCIKEIST